MEGALLHYCEDGHHWTEQPDGGVSPSWGFGLTSIHYPDWRGDMCPEPERGYSRYANGGPDHGYRCPTCGEVHYVGGCNHNFMPVKPPHEEPPPVCGKPPVRTLAWVTPMRRKGNHVFGWVPLAEYERNGQLLLEVAS